MASILEGLTVVELGTGSAVAMAAMLLADQGARVVRVCSPTTGEPRSGGCIVWDRGKEAVAIDLDVAAAQVAASERRVGSPGDVWLRLIGGADIVIDDLPPSSPWQALLDHALLRRTNPRLVGCSVTAYGKRGPLRDEPAIDDLVLARMGVLGGMPGFRPAPVHVVHPLPSVGAALLADIGITGALLARETTARGRFVETSLMAGALLYHPKVDGERIAPHVFQTHPAGSAPFYSNYECSDGRYIQLGCVHPGFIAIAAGLMGISALVAEPRFDQGRGGKTPADVQEMRDTIARIMKTRPAAEWAAAFEAADVPFAPCRMAAEGLDDLQVRHNGLVTTLEDPVVGAVTQMGVAIAFGRTPGNVSGPRRGQVGGDVPKDWPRRQMGTASPARDADVDPPPLTGVRVLEITNLIAGPTCGRLLADLGADVIKLEPPGGDMSRPIGRTYFYHVNFEKRSICVDTSTEAGKQVAQRIAARADALVANLRPHATERMGIGPELNPRLVETHLTGYGWTGPYAKRPGIDPLAQALMGLQRAQGGPDNPPVFPAQLAPTDYTTGALGALGTILALYHRARTGVAQRVDVNLLTGGILLSSPWFTRYQGKPERPLADKGQYGLGPFHRLFQLADGWIYVVAETQAQRHAVLAWAGLEPARLAEFEAPSHRHPNESPLAHVLAAAVAGRRVVESLAVLRGAGVACAEAQKGDSALFLTDPHALENDMVAIREHPKVGRLRVAWRSIQFAETGSTLGRATPLLGEHTDAVLREVRYSDREIRALHDAGTVRAERV
jgi:crotonobetainyl-CoA:carnitine CoA-transferase CaiB-like acyl-CoA transferase